MCVASAEKSGWSAELLRGFGIVDLLAKRGLINSEVDAPELRGVARSELVEIVVELLVSRTALAAEACSDVVSWPSTGFNM